MSDLSTLPKGDSAWLLRKAIERIIQQVSVLETNIGSSTTGNSANTQIIFNDNGTLRGDTGLVFNKTTDALTVAGLVTAGSATITGDLTVDTSTLKVDSTNNTVGIGNATPPTGASNTDIGLTLGAAGTVRSVLLGMQNCFGRIRERDATNNLAITTNIGATGTLDDNTRSSWKIRIGSGNDNYVLQRAAIGSSTFNDLLAIDSAGVCVWSDGAGGTRMTLNSTGLGVGVSPAVNLDIASASTTQFRIQRSGQADVRVISDTGVGIFGTYSNHTLQIRTNGTAAIICDTSGNVGVGVTPAGTGGCLQLKSGITFPVTQVASSDANTLDDYEEGTWTGTLAGLTTSPTVAVTTTGRYTKIGREVKVSIYFQGVSTVGASGIIRITGLPFTSANDGVGSIGTFSTDLAATFTGYVVAALGGNSSIIEFASSQSNGAGGFATHNAGLNRYVAATLTYNV